MLPSANKCIDKIAFDGFGSDFEFEGRIPKIRIQLKDSCKDLKGIDKLGLYGDVAGKLTDIHFTFFEDHNLSVDISKGIWISFRLLGNQIFILKIIIMKNWT